MATPIQKCIAEFLGTFALCFVGILGIHHMGSWEAALLGVALAHGVTITVMIAAVGHISAAHFNPSVTIGLLAVGKMKPGLAAGYLAAQFLAGFAAAGLLIPLLGDAPYAALSAGTPSFDPEVITIPKVILLEVILTFFLVFMIYGCGFDKRPPKSSAALYIGMAVVMGILAGGPLTGAAMNPARHLGSAMLSGDAAVIGQTWVYWVGPLTGGVIACALYRFVLELPDDETDTAPSAEG